MADFEIGASGFVESQRQPMIYPVTYQAAHFHQLALQPSQVWLRAYASDANLQSLENEHAFTLMRDGKPRLCCGAVMLWKNRAYVWSMIGSVVAWEFREVHSWAKRFLAGLPYRRLEAAVDVNFEAGHRWMRSLGFEREADCMKAYQVDGRNCALYARVRS